MVESLVSSVAQSLVSGARTLEQTATNAAGAVASTARSAAQTATVVYENVAAGARNLEQSVAAASRGVNAWAPPPAVTAGLSAVEAGVVNGSRLLLADVSAGVTTVVTAPAALAAGVAYVGVGLTVNAVKMVQLHQEGRLAENFSTLFWNGPLSVPDLPQHAPTGGAGPEHTAATPGPHGSPQNAVQAAPTPVQEAGRPHGQDKGEPIGYIGVPGKEGKPGSADHQLPGDFDPRDPYGINKMPPPTPAAPPTAPAKAAGNPLPHGSPQNAASRVGSRNPPSPFPSAPLPPQQKKPPVLQDPTPPPPVGPSWLPTPLQPPLRPGIPHWMNQEGVGKPMPVRVGPTKAGMSNEKTPDPAAPPKPEVPMPRENRYDEDPYYKDGKPRSIIGDLDDLEGPGGGRLNYDDWGKNPLRDNEEFDVYDDDGNYLGNTEEGTWPKSDSGTKASGVTGATGSATPTPAPMRTLDKGVPLSNGAPPVPPKLKLKN